jgi:hypothetical protein
VAFALGLLIYPAVDKEIPVISLSDLFRFPDVWLFLTWVTEPYNILLALVVIMITTKEFSNHTFKTQVVFGLSRTELLLQKLMLSMVRAGPVCHPAAGIATSLTLGLIYSYKLTFQDRPGEHVDPGQVPGGFRGLHVHGACWWPC